MRSIERLPPGHRSASDAARESDPRRPDVLSGVLPVDAHFKGFEDRAARVPVAVKAKGGH